jgi:pimeloyl-ACP methyl ester carboxylesterase
MLVLDGDTPVAVKSSSAAPTTEDTMAATEVSDRVSVGDVELYVEVRGTGPALLLVPGAGGDGGQYAELVRQMEGSHTVATYDRRSNSRSSRPNGWQSTSIEQQADDAAGLLTALGFGPAVVFGNSTGALVALATALRAPESVTALVVHEPALMSVLADPDGAMGAVQPVIAAGMESGGLAGGAEAFLRFAAGPAYEQLSVETRERILGNADVLFEAEFGAFASWAPDVAQLTKCSVPTTVLNGEHTAPFFQEAAVWVADRLQTTVGTAPGGHMGFLDEPTRFATVLLEIQRG